MANKSNFSMSNNLPLIIGIIICILVGLVSYGVLKQIGPGNSSIEADIIQQFNSANEPISSVKIKETNYSQTSSNQQIKQVNFTGSLDGITLEDTINYTQNNSKWENGAVQGIENNKFQGILTPNDAKQLLKGEEIDNITINDLSQLQLSNGNVNLNDETASYDIKYVDKEIGITNVLTAQVQFSHGQNGWCFTNYSNANIQSTITDITNDDFISWAVQDENGSTSIVNKSDCKIISSSMNKAARTATATLEISHPSVNSDSRITGNFTLNANLGVNATSWDHSLTQNS